MTPDMINALFELGGAIALSVSVRKLLHDREVRGISWASIAFFVSWSIWNLAYYPALDQWLSLASGALSVAVQLVYVALLMRFTWYPDPRK